MLISRHNVGWSTKPNSGSLAIEEVAIYNQSNKDMSTQVKVQDLVFARISAPDLGAAERFLTDFGLVRSAKTSDALYMRGTEPTHHVFVVELGEPSMIGLGFSVASIDDLIKASKLEGASRIEEVSEPGGGTRVTLRDPLGLRLELIHGASIESSIATESNPINDATDRYRRVGRPTRPARGPSHVRNLGHAVLVTQDVMEVTRWYQSNLGLLCSDLVCKPGESDEAVGTFLRVDQGSAYVDHHAINITAGAIPGIHHLAFEVRDLDDLMIGHEYLSSKEYSHIRGPGRHVIGSQVFDYWMGHGELIFEHYIDTDVMNCDSTQGRYEAGKNVSPWGESSSPKFRDHVFV